VVVALITFHIM